MSDLITRLGNLAEALVESTAFSQYCQLVYEASNVIEQQAKELAEVQARVVVLEQDLDRATNGRYGQWEIDRAKIMAQALASTDTAAQTLRQQADQQAQPQVDMAEVTRLVRSIHESLKRGNDTEDHGLIGNLRCILDSDKVSGALPDFMSEAQPARYLTDEEITDLYLTYEIAFCNEHKRAPIGEQYFKAGYAAAIQKENNHGL